MESNETQGLLDLAFDLRPSVGLFQRLPDWLHSLATFLYIVDPAKYKDQSTPDIYNQLWPYLLVLFGVEQILVCVQGYQRARLNDTLTSLSLGLMQERGRLVCRGAETCLYAWIHSHFKVIEVNWSHSINFYAAALLVDFCYYWVHRACHEVHILWAQHQVHHSSEQMNVAVGVRQSLLQGWCGLIIYLPLAFLLPTKQLLIHHQISLLYQIWLHTEVIGSLGPLEYIFNTPSHHRVHHGSNKYCLDKNYGGFLIIWDRLFGTFAEDLNKEKIVYGLVYNQPSFNPVHLQTFYTQYVWQKVRLADGWRHKIAAIFYGPSWVAGSPRLGWDRDKIDVKPREKYNVMLPMWLNVYIVLHFMQAFSGWNEFRLLNTGAARGLVFALQTIWTLSCVGLLLDGSKWGPPLECTRVAFNALLPTLTPYTRAASILTALCWLAVSVGVVPVKLFKSRHGETPPSEATKHTENDIYITEKMLPVL